MHNVSFKDHSFYISEKSTIGLQFEFHPLEIENRSDEQFHKMNEFIRNLPPNILVRISTAVRKSHQYQHSARRATAVSELGFTETVSVISIEIHQAFNPINTVISNLFKKETDLEKQFEILLSLKDRLNDVFPALTHQKVQEASIKGAVISERSIETEHGSTGLLRIFKLPQAEFEALDFHEKLMRLPKPFIIHTAFSRMDDVRTKLLLEKKKKQTVGDTSTEAGAQNELTEELLQLQFKDGVKFFEYEYLIEFLRSSKEELTKTLLEAKSVLQGFEVIIETYGLYPSFLATKPGHTMHVPMIEGEAALSAILPVYGRKELKSPEFAYNRSLPLLRSDGHLWHFDLFNPKYNTFNTLLIGTSGKGKSVLLGQLTQSLLHDDNLCIIKLDVGGSHSKECELFGGTEYEMSLEKGSGINPFEILLLSEATESDKIAILSKFLITLIQEQGELFIQKNLRAEIEDSVRRYIELNSQNPSLQEFFDKSSEFPRRDLLKRWTRGGIYESAFKDTSPCAANAPGNTRLRYYNFSKIFQAADPEFAIAGVAAVLARYNTELLKNDGKRVVLICDEMPFFIKHCFEFFKFSTANLRKVGNAVILTSQISSDFVVGGDTGIIDNSPQRFLFSVDGNEQDFAARLNLSKDAVQNIKSLRTVSGQYSQMLFQSEDSELRLQLEITKKEYWELTTSRVDKDRIVQLMGVVKGLSLQEAIACLSVER